MTAVAIGSNIDAALSEEFAPAQETVTPTPTMDLDAMRALIHAEMNQAVADVERRLAQAREIERSNALGLGRTTVHTEDLNLGFAMIDGYTLTANSPANGSIAWSSLHVVLLGIDYTVTDANTALKYAWFVKPAAGVTTVTLQTSNTLPTLANGDALIFVNNGGVPVSVLESSVTYAVGAGVIGSAQLDSATQQVLSNLQASDTAIQSRIDGVITSYYQDNPPWPAGAPSAPVGGGGGGDVNMGDIWYDSNDGGAFRWTGATGSPANTWQRIADTDTSSIAAKVNTKVTTYLGGTAPVAPSGGFTAGDLWIDSATGNVVKRWSGSAWVANTIGDAALASGISGAKIGSGIDAGNVSSGTLAAARVGAGVNGAALGTATGTIGNTQIGSGAVTPAKVNAAFHILY